MTDFQIFFVPTAGFEARQQTVSVLTHATSVRASGAFGISVMLDSDGVKQGTILELTGFRNRDRCLHRLKIYREGALLREKVWGLALECFAAISQQIPDSRVVIEAVERHQMIRVLSDRCGTPHQHTSLLKHTCYPPFHPSF